MPIIIHHINSAIKLYNPSPIVVADDSSIQSTIAAVTPKNKTTTQRVRFSATPPRCYDNRMMCQEDIRSECWLRPRDYKHFRLAALEASRQIIAVEQRNRAPFSYQRVLERTCEACCQVLEETSSNKPVLAPAEFVHLQRWIEVASSRIGLEKWSIRKIATDKALRRHTLNLIIREEKQKAAYSSCYDSDENSDSNNENEQEKMDAADYLAETCARISRPSRLLARTLAQATAAAVQKDEFFSDV